MSDIIGDHQPMKTRSRNLRNHLSMLALGILSSFALKAQSTLHCMEGGSWLPVFEVKGEVPYCFTGDSLLKSSSDKLTMLSSRRFGAGYFEVEILENTRSGVTRSDGSLRFTADHGWFEFSAKVTAREDIEDAYFVLRYDRFGEAVFTCRSLGSLKKGKSRVITIFRRLEYEMPEQLHFYSGMEEIRSNLVPSSYTYKFGDFILASSE